VALVFPVLGFGDASSVSEFGYRISIRDAGITCSYIPIPPMKIVSFLHQRNTGYWKIQLRIISLLISIASRWYLGTK
jgi:hypothetical protein